MFRVFIGVALLVCICSDATVYTNAVKFKSQLLERLMQNTKTGPLTPERLNSLSWFLQLHVQRQPKEVASRGVLRLEQPTNQHLRRGLRHQNTLDVNVRNTISRNRLRMNDYASGGLTADYVYQNDPASVWDIEDSVLEDLSSDYDHYSNTHKDIDNEIQFMDELPPNLEATYSAQTGYTHYGAKQSINIQDVDYQPYLYPQHEDVCKTRKTWQLLNETINQRGERVRILPNTTDGGPQYVYVHKCVHDECTRCKGVQSNSRCVMRESFLKLYHEVLDYDNYASIKYDYVRVPTHCTCELLPDNFHQAGCSMKQRDNIRLNQG